MLSISTIVFYTGCVKENSTEVHKKDSFSKTNTIPGSPIVYTDLIPDDTLRVFSRNTVSTYHLDLNHDGITDFDISISMYGAHCSTEPPPYSVIINSFVSRSGANSFGDSSLIVGLRKFISPLITGRKINQDLITWTGNSSGTLQSSVSCNNPYPRLWSGATDKYLALRLVVGSSVYFGWLRLEAGYLKNGYSYTNLNSYIIIKDYAYNSIPNQPILAGQTK